MPRSPDIRSKYRSARTPSHRYTLWIGCAGPVQDVFTVKATVFEMGIHGDVVSNSASTELQLRDCDDGETNPMRIIIGHNHAEWERAREEGRKWHERLRASPLGKTQQDFVAFYDEVIGRFEAWLKDHELTK